MENVTVIENNLTKNIRELIDNIPMLGFFALAAGIGVHAFGTSQIVSVNHILLEYAGMLTFFLFSLMFDMRYHFYKIEKKLERKNEG
jgi:hypothetical protein